MSVQTEESGIQYAGNDSITTAYAAPFYFFTNEDLQVVVTAPDGTDTQLTLGTDYAVADAGNPSGGSITTTAAWNSTYKVTISRVVAATQLTDYVENADFPAASHELALDKLTMLCQQIDRSVVRSFRLRESDGELGEAAEIENSVLGLDGLGAPIFRTSDEVASWLNLTTQIFDRPMKTWNDAGERAAAVPDFTGQIGSQRDNSTTWIATGMAAGSWIASTLGGNVLDLSGMTVTYPAGGVGAADLAATLDLSAKSLTLPAASVTYANLGNDAKLFLSGYNNLRVAYASTSTLTIDVAAMVLYDGTSGYARHISPPTITLDITMVGANGREAVTAEVSGIWYYIWMISNGTTLAGLLSTSDIAPIPPTGYTYRKLLGAVYNDSSGNFINFTQRNEKAWCPPQQVFTSKAGVTSLTSQALTAQVPHTATEARGTIGSTSTNIGTIAISADLSGTAQQHLDLGGGNGGGVLSDGYAWGPSFNVPLISPQTLYWATINTSTFYRMHITGWSYNH